MQGKNTISLHFREITLVVVQRMDYREASQEVERPVTRLL